MIVAAFDTSKWTGWAVGDLESGRPRFGVWELDREDADDFAGPLIDLEGRVNRLIDHHAPDLIAFEQPLLVMPRFDKKTKRWILNTNVKTLRLLYSLAAKIEEISRRRGIECVESRIGEVKSHWTGNGNAPKELMIQIARERGFDIPEGARMDNAADALAVWFHQMALRAPHATERLQRAPGALFEERENRHGIQGAGARSSEPDPSLDRERDRSPPASPSNDIRGGRDDRALPPDLPPVDF